MSWKAKEDLGTQIVASVQEQLRIGDEWRVDAGRGFTWWAGDYAQSVWADVGNFHNSITLYRLHAECELFKATGGIVDKCEEPIAKALANANLSAITYDADKEAFKFHCSVYASTDNADWLTRTFLGAIALQLSFAQKHGLHMSQAYCGKAATSQHPERGPRTEPDPVTRSEEMFFRPAGGSQSRWCGGTEWEEADDRIYRLAQMDETDKTSWLKADFEWCGGGGEPIQLEITAEKPHPQLGNGLTCTLDVPLKMPESVRAHFAMSLSEMERREWNWCHDLGSWCVMGEHLAFHCFVPNLCYAPGCLPELAHDMGMRAQWVNEQFAQGKIGG